MSLLEQNKVLSVLSRKKDFDRLKQTAQVFSYQWLKAFFLYEERDKSISLAWSLPKSYIAQAVLRNRLKRWGREALRKNAFKGHLFIVFLKREKSFYRNMKRKDFDSVFKKLLENLEKKA